MRAPRTNSEMKIIYSISASDAQKCSVDHSSIFWIAIYCSQPRQFFYCHFFLLCFTRYILSPHYQSAAKKLNCEDILDKDMVDAILRDYNVKNIVTTEGPDSSKEKVPCRTRLQSPSTYLYACIIGTKLLENALKHTPALAHRHAHAGMHTQACTHAHTGMHARTHHSWLSAPKLRSMPTTTCTHPLGKSLLSITPRERLAPRVLPQGRRTHLN